jgi:hypothetical protein
MTHLWKAGNIPQWIAIPEIPNCGWPGRLPSRFTGASRHERTRGSPARSCPSASASRRGGPTRRADRAERGVVSASFASSTALPEQQAPSRSAASTWRNSITSRSKDGLPTRFGGSSSEKVPVAHLLVRTSTVPPQAPSQGASNFQGPRRVLGLFDSHMQVATCRSLT